MRGRTATPKANPRRRWLSHGCPGDHPLKSESQPRRHTHVPVLQQHTMPSCTQRFFEACRRRNCLCRKTRRTRASLHSSKLTENEENAGDSRKKNTGACTGDSNNANDTIWTRLHASWSKGRSNVPRTQRESTHFRGEDCHSARFFSVGGALFRFFSVGAL